MVDDEIVGIDAGIIDKNVELSEPRLHTWNKRIDCTVIGQIGAYRHSFSARALNLIRNCFGLRFVPTGYDDVRARAVQ
jgi:hypothetical protein